MLEEFELSTADIQKSLRYDLVNFFIKYFSAEGLNTTTLPQLYTMRYHAGTAIEKLSTLQNNLEGKEINRQLDGLLMSFNAAKISRHELIECINNYIDFYILSYIEKRNLLNTSFTEQCNLVKACTLEPKSIFTVHFSKEQETLPFQSFKFLEEQLYNYIRRIFYLGKYQFALSYFDFPVDQYTLIVDSLAVKLEFKQQLIHLRNDSKYKYKITSLGLTEVLDQTQHLFTHLLELAQTTTVKEITEKPNNYFSMAKEYTSKLRMDGSRKQKMEEELYTILTKMYPHFHNGDIIAPPTIEEDIELE
jgi:hypothetical protein